MTHCSFHGKLQSKSAHQDENYGLFIANNYILSEVSKIASTTIVVAFDNGGL